MLRQLLLKELEMQPANIPIVLLAIAIALLAAPGAVVAASAAGPAGYTAADRLWAVASEARALLVAGYHSAPALVAVLSAFVVLPAIAVLSFAVHGIARRKAHRVAVRAAERGAEGNGPVDAESADAGLPLRPRLACLRIESDGATALPLAGALVRLGRHQDNDIRLPDTSVHRYHALIERTPEAAFVITDLSGRAGNGVRINGARQARAELTDGDVIELGRTRLRFESALL